VGIAGGVAGLAVGAAQKAAERKRLLKGRTPEQQAAIKYFLGAGGCFGKCISDEEYESMVMAKAKAFDFRKKALEKIGLDESQVNEVPPVHFEGYAFDGDSVQEKQGADRVLRSSSYQVTWLFFSSSQVFVYQYTFSLIDEAKKERTEEFFYKDISSFTTDSKTVEFENLVGGGCLGKAKFERVSVETNLFSFAGFYCAMTKNDYTEKAIQGMKAKLREKKG